MARLFDDALSQYLRVESAPVIAPPFTVACRFKSDNVTVAQTLVSLADASKTNQMFRLVAYGSGAGDPLRATAVSATAAAAATSTGFTANTWHRACGVFAAADDRRVYLDGGGKGTSVISRVVTGVDRMAIGTMADSTPAWYMSGPVAEVVIWSAALTDAEAAAHGAGAHPTTIRPASLIFWAPLMRDEDKDFVGGLSFTAYNSPTVGAHPPVAYPRPIMIGIPPSGVLTISPTGIASAEALGSVSVLSDQTVDPAGLASAEALGALSLALGAVTMTPTGLVSAEALGAATLALGAVTIEPTGLVSAEALGAAALALGAVVLEPTGLVTAEAFGTAMLELHIEPAGISTGELFGSHTVAPGVVTITATSIGTAEAIGSHTLAMGAVAITPAGIATAEALGTPLMVLRITPTSIASAEAIGAAIVVGAIMPASIGSEEGFGVVVVVGGEAGVARSMWEMLLLVPWKEN